MSDTNQGNTPPQDDDLPQPEVRKSKLGFSLIWLVPIIAALVGISLLVTHFTSAGPKITVTFLTAEGIEANKTQVKYKNVVIGKVTTMRLSKDRTHISVVIDLEKDAAAFATKGTRYWWFVLASARAASRVSTPCCPVLSSARMPAIRKKTRTISPVWKPRLP